MAAGLEGRWTHGFDEDGWDEACREVREFLITVARRSEAKPFISMAELATKVTAIPFSRAPGRKPGAVLAGLLSDVDRVELAAGQPMLSALVSDDTHDPARRFAPAARRLGRRGADDEVMWIAEVKAVRAFWANEAAGQGAHSGPRPGEPEESDEDDVDSAH